MLLEFALINAQSFDFHGVNVFTNPKAIRVRWKEDIPLLRRHGLTDENMEESYKIFKDEILRLDISCNG